MNSVTFLSSEKNCWNGSLLQHSVNLRLCSNCVLKKKILVYILLICLFLKPDAHLLIIFHPACLRISV